MSTRGQRIPVNALTVCVDYSAELQRTLPRWSEVCDSIVVVTAPRDHATASVARQYQNVAIYPTERFYEHGASFNKGAAMEDALRAMRWRDWILFFDADILPPADFALPDLRSGNLYGIHRVQEGGEMIPDNEIAGYFQLFHASDPRVQDRPLLDTFWQHAGNYDSTFQAKWPFLRRLWLPGTVIHIGRLGVNWFGRGNILKAKAMREERARRGGNFDHERIRKS